MYEPAQYAQKYNNNNKQKNARVYTAAGSRLLNGLCSGWIDAQDVERARHAVRAKKTNVEQFAVKEADVGEMIGL